MTFEEALLYMAKRPEEHFCLNNHFKYRMSKKYELQYFHTSDRLWRKNNLGSFPRDWNVLLQWEECTFGEAMLCLEKGEEVRGGGTVRKKDEFGLMRPVTGGAGFHEVAGMKWERKIV